MPGLDWHADRAGLDGLAQIDREPPGDIDLAAVRAHRLRRVRGEMASRGIPACILSDPVNIHHATGTRNMQVFTSRNTPSRHLLLTEDRSILFEFAGCAHLAEGLETVTEVRPAVTASFVAAGPGIARRERRWAAEMASLLRETAGAGATVGMERLNAGAALALAAEGFSLVDAQEPVEMARCVKSPEEMKCVRASLRATEEGVRRLQEAVRPGVTENAPWSALHQAVTGLGGDHVETRLPSPGPRTNPWFQESSARVIGENELVALDTDVVGCHGHHSDFSRTFRSGPGRPSAAQRELYRVAHEQVRHNIGIIRPGMGFREYADAAWDIPGKYFANRYYLSAHGVGMTGEYPYLYHRADFPDAGHDGEILPGMTICVESHIGLEGGPEGVKLEEQVLVTESGTEVLSRYPFESSLLG